MRLTTSSTNYYPEFVLAPGTHRAASSQDKWSAVQMPIPPAISWLSQSLWVEIANLQTATKAALVDFEDDIDALFLMDDEYHHIPPREALTVEVEVTEVKQGHVHGLDAIEEIEYYLLDD